MAERTVEVAIRAKDEATEAIQSFVRAVGAAGKSTEQFREDLAKTDKQFGALVEATDKVRGAVQTLKEVSSTATRFQKLRDELTTLNQKLSDNRVILDAAAVAQQKAAAVAAQAVGEYNKTTTALKALTNEQDQLIAREKQLAKTVSAAERFEKLTASADKYEKELNDLTAANAKQVEEQRRLQTQVLTTSRALATATDETQKAALAQERAAATTSLKKITKELGPFRTASEALRTKITQTAASIETLGASIQKSGVDSRELLRPLDQLKSELAAVGNQVKVLDGQIAPLNGAFQNAKNAATTTAQALREANADLGKAQTNYNKVEKEVTNLGGKLTELGGKLDQAGVDTRQLASEQDRLQSELQQTQRSLRDAEGSTQKYAKAASQAAGAQENFLEKGRKALSFTQRIRGQVLSLASAYFGLFGVINQVTAAFQTNQKLQSARNSLLVANNGDQQAAAQDFAYVTAQADRLGQSLDTLAAQYAKLRVSAKNANVSANSVNFIFEALSEGATTLSLSGEQVDRVFNAVSQIFSKGKINAEELSQQLGDNLYGSVGLLAKGLGLAEADLLALVKAGNLTSEALIALASEARKTYKDGFEQASKSSLAEFNRLKNGVTELRVAFVAAAEESGLAEALRGLRQELSDPELQNGVRELGKAFVELVKALPEAIKLVDDFVIALAALQVGKALNALKLFQLAAATSIGAAVAAVGTLITTLTTTLVAAFTGAGAAAIKLRGVLVATLSPASLAIAAAGIYLLWENSETFRKGIIALIATVDTWRVKIVAGVKLVSILVTGYFKSLTNGLLDLAVQFGIDVADFFGLDQAVVTLRSMAAKLRKAAVEEKKKTVDEFVRVAKDANAELAAIDEATTQFFIDNTDGGPQPAQTTGSAPMADQQAAEAERLLLERQNALRELNKDIDKAIGKLAPKQAKENEDLQALLNQVVEKYQSMYDQIDRLDPADREAAKAKVDSLVTQEQTLVRQKFYKEEGDKRVQLAAQARDAILEGEQNFKEKLAQLSGDPKAILDAQLKEVEEKYRETYEKIDQLKGKEAEQARARLDKLVADEQALLRAQAETRGGLVQELQDSLLQATDQGAKVELEKLRAEFERTVNELKAIGRTDGIGIAQQLFDVQSAKVELDDLQQRYSKIVESFDVAQERAANAIQTGGNPATARQDVEAARAKALADLQALSAEYERLAQLNIPGATAAAAEFNATLARLGQGPAGGVKATLADLRAELDEATQSFGGNAIKALRDGLTGFFQDIATGSMSAKEAFQGFALGVLQSLTQLVSQILANQIILSIFGGPAGGGAGLFAGLFHSGGIVGRSSGRSRRVDPAIFAAAQRYHSGGMVGLQPDEVPAILQRGEEVLSRGDPRNAMNGGASPQQPVQVKVVNAIDSGDFISQGLNTSRGQEAVLNFIRANKGALA